MKRIKAACITQTLHFLLNDKLSTEFAKRMVQEEVKKYKESLEKSGTKYKLLSEELQPDGSIIVEVKKQYNYTPVGNYLD